MPDDLKTMREAAAKKALAPKEEPMSLQAWRERVGSIIAQSGLDEQTLSELRGDPAYMDAWKKGAKSVWGRREPEAMLEEWVKPVSPVYGDSNRAESVGYTADDSQLFPAGAEADFPDDRGKRIWAGRRSKAAEELGELEGEMAAVERRMRGEHKPTQGE